MTTIFYLMGKSSSGKDTIYKRLLDDPSLNLKPIVLYTTRPMRSGEQNGVTYHFSSIEQLQTLRQQQRIIEERAYHTVHGIWNYFTVYDTQFDCKNSLLMIGTLESYLSTKAYFAKHKPNDIHVVPLYIEVDDGIRLERALLRERMEPNPRYEEMCRRFLADQKDFSEEQLTLANIDTRYQNLNLEKCILEIKATIMQSL